MRVALFRHAFPEIIPAGQQNNSGRDTAASGDQTAGPWRRNRMPTRSSATILAKGIVLALTAAAGATANPPAPQPAPAPSSGTGADSAASQLPPLRAGLWEYRRTVFTAADTKPQKTTFQVCADPNAEIRERLETLRKKGCVFSPVLTRGKQYQSSWRCPVSSGVLVDHNIMLVTDDSSYQADNE